MQGRLGRFLAAFLMLVVTPLCSKAEDDSTGIDPSLVIEQFKVYNDGDLLLVPVQAFGKERMFAVDTGSSTTVYDKSLRPFLGEPLKWIEWFTPGGNATTELFDSPKTFLGEFSLNADKPVVCFDLSELNRVSGHRMEGLLGMAMLSKHVVHISSDEGKLSILKRAPQDAGEEFKLSWWKGIPMVEAEIAGYGSAYFQLDTGCLNTAGLLNGDLASTLEERNLAEVFDRGACWQDLSGVVELISLRVQELRLGSHVLRGLSMDAVGENRPSVLGMRFLSRFNVTFDFPNSTLYLQKSNRFNHSELPDLGGIMFVSGGAGTVVDDVQEDSPAAKAGIRVNDIVLKVGNQDASGASFFKLYDEFTLPGRTVHVRLLRDGELIETDVKLPDEKQKESVARSR